MSFQQQELSKLALIFHCHYSLFSHPFVFIVGLNITALYTCSGIFTISYYVISLHYRHFTRRLHLKGSVVPQQRGKEGANHAFQFFPMTKTDFYGQEGKAKFLPPKYAIDYILLQLFSIGRRAFCVCVPGLWNALPLSFRSATSLSSFKRSLKTHYFQTLTPS